MNLRGERIELRELTLDDLEAIHMVANHPEAHRYQPFGPNTPEETRIYLRGVVERGRECPRRDYTLAIVLAATQELLGYASLWATNPEFRQAEIGFFLHPRHWGYGYASEVAYLLVRRAFRELDLHRVFATADPRNSASRRVPEKVGMVYEGRLHNDMVPLHSFHTRSARGAGWIFDLPAVHSGFHARTYPGGSIAVLGMTLQRRTP